MRDETYRVLEAIPEILSRANDCCSIYPDSPKLEFFVSKLYVAMMRAIGEIMDWYNKSSTSKVISALLKGNGYGQAMDACHDKLFEVALKVEKEAGMELHGSVGKLHSKMDAILQQNALLEQMVMQNGMEIFRDSERIFLRTQADIRRERQLVADQRRKEQVRQQEAWRRKQFILSCVQFNPDELLADQEIVLGEGLAMNRRDQGYAAIMLQTPEVRVWLGSPCSTALAINAGEVYSRTTSSVSLASALLTRTISTNVNAVVLSWYCGLHTGDNDVHNMIASMIGQLCQSKTCGIDFNTFWNESLASMRMYAANTKMLLNILSAFLQEQLKYTPIYMVIDGISFYESVYYYQQTLDFFDSMQWLTRFDSYSLKPFRLLVTSPRTMETETVELLGAQLLDLDPLQVRNASSYGGAIDQYMA